MSTGRIERLTSVRSSIFSWLRRSRLGPIINAIPVPVRFHDRRVRLATLALWRLHYVWRSHPSLEQEACAVYETYAGGDVLDVGAFEGWYSVLLAAKAGGATLVSFEPDPPAFRELQQTLTLLSQVFPGPRFIPIPVPVGDGRPVGLSQPAGAHPRYAADSVGGGGSTTASTVDGMVNLLGLSPKLVKIDVEGGELFVLRGMEETISVHRPKVMLELHPALLPEGTQPADVTNLLRRQGYSPRPIDSRQRQWVSRSLWTP
jgi:FkbM family methyltransferase